MAIYTTTLRIAAPPEATFAYVSDFRHATWDPRVSSARRVGSDGPIGVGTSFVLASPLPIGSIEFHYTITAYDITAYDPPHRVVLTGSTWFARYTDDISCRPDGSGGTSMEYQAKFDLRGLLGLGEPIMQWLFRRVGNDATRGIPAAVVRGA
jgi:carbon monoxide dehydrogenase subunit G